MRYYRFPRIVRNGKNAEALSSYLRRRPEVIEFRITPTGDQAKTTPSEALDPKANWNRDLRAGGISEGQDADEDIEDQADHAGHASSRTTDSRLRPQHPARGPHRRGAPRIPQAPRKVNA
jgi:hypothetical protein